MTRAGEERDADVRNVPRTEGTKPTSEGTDSVPLDREQPGLVAGVPDDHSHAANPQGKGPFDRGVDPEHLRSPSQGARPEGIDDATDPDEPGAVSGGPPERPR